MAFSSLAHSITTAVIGTEHTLLSTTSAYIFVLQVNCGSMYLGDETELRVKTRVVSEASLAVGYISIYAHQQGVPIKWSPPVPANQGVDITLKQTGGTGRDFMWRIYSL